MDSTRPIGVFDSGVGGLSVLKHVRRLLPAEDLLYVSDRAHLPYGGRDARFVEERAEAICRFFVGEGAKAILIACNTATAAAARHLRARFDLPIVGMEPGLKPGVLESRGRAVAVLATEGTLSSEKFRDLTRRHGRGAEVLIRPCHGWIELVEAGQLDGPVARRAVAAELEPLLKAGAETLVLGCTHYPFLAGMIREVVGDAVRVIDTGPAVARELKRRLHEVDLLRPGDHPGTEAFWTSGPTEAAAELVARLWGVAHPVRALPPGDSAPAADTPACGDSPRDGRSRSEHSDEQGATRRTA